jgi:hypothetical protein
MDGARTPNDVTKSQVKKDNNLKKANQVGICGGINIIDGIFISNE